MAAFFSGTAYADKKVVQLDADSSIVIDYRIDSEPAKEGEPFAGRFLISIPEGWHLYGKGAVGHAPLTVAFADETKNKSSNFYYPKPVVKKVGSENLPIYEGETVINFTSAEASSAKEAWKVVVSWQACSSSICLRPHEELISLNF
jgi:DsbC/DsbD-like thiol-disulfide interchange protein